jgi:chromosome segregation ATPase
MANDNKKINILVSALDEDPTSEFEVCQRIDNADVNVPPILEVDEKTFDIDRFAIGDSDESATLSAQRNTIREQAETIERLEFELEEHRAKTNGLSREVSVREEISANISKEFKSVRQHLVRSQKELQDRQHEIAFLQHSLYEAGEATLRIQSNTERVQHQAAQELADCRRQIAEKSGLISSNAQELRELTEQLERTEKYADSLRSKLQTKHYSSFKSENSQRELERSLQSARSALDELRGQLADEKVKNNRQEKEIAQMKIDFEKELRQVRFELGEAQETISCKDSMNEQLTSDLIDNRGFRQALESQLGEFERESQLETQNLMRQLRSAQREADEYERKLKAKDQAISALMNELESTNRPDPHAEDQHTELRKVDGYRSGRDQSDNQSRFRVARLLIGDADGRELRFPLFKDRLTIGRTTNNDIQLNARYISRRHAVIVTDNGQTRLVDWGSKNGVYVNQMRVAERFLKSGDILTIGTTKFRYEERPKR